MSNIYPENKVRVSEVVGCLRKSFFKRYINKRENITTFSLWGRIAENEIKRKILPRFKGYFENVVCQKGILIGHPDFVDYINQRVIELKFRWRRNPKIADLSQANAYACMLGFQQFTIRVSWLEYTPNLHLNYSDLTFPARYDRFKVLLEKADLLLLSLQGRNPYLIRSYPQWNYECLYCPYTWECQELSNWQDLEKGLSN